MKNIFYSYLLGDSFDFQWNERTRNFHLTDEIKKKFKLFDNSKTRIYIPYQDEPIFDFGEWKVSGKYLEDILGNASEVTVIVKYTMMSKVSDTIAKPHKVKISSDVQREIICPKIGRTAEGFFHQDIVDERTLQYQLTTSVSYVFSEALKIVTW
jgi:hypothetical protein